MSNPIARVQDVSKIYRQGKIEVRALDGVSLSIEPRDFAVLAGPSGSGKTTMLNLIGALDVPTQGSIYLEGTNVADMSGSSLARLRLQRIGFVFQAYNLLPVLTAYENVEYPLLLQGVAAKDRRKRTLEALEAVGLKGLEGRRPSELSGGQQQRVAVARAVASAPLLVLADEPTANLDRKTGSELVEMMHRLNREQGVTFLFSSHDATVIERAERMIRLEDGKIVSDERGRAHAS
jgi:putative ABC transport system ATP-binding protein